VPLFCLPLPLFRSCVSFDACAGCCRVCCCYVSFVAVTDSWILVWLRCLFPVVPLFFVLCCSSVCCRFCLDSVPFVRFCGFLLDVDLFCCVVDFRCSRLLPAALFFVLFAIVVELPLHVYRFRVTAFVHWVRSLPFVAMDTSCCCLFPLLLRWMLFHLLPHVVADAVYRCLDCMPFLRSCCCLSPSVACFCVPFRCISADSLL